MVIYKWEKQAKAKYKSHGDGGSNGRNRRREVRMYIALCISGSSSLSPSTRMFKATASTAIATGNLRQGRLMAGHGGLYSATKLREIEAKGG
jgi:hypothetical protein